MRFRADFAAGLLFAAVLTANHASATTFYVDGSTGDDTRDGLSWSTAFATVSRALELAFADHLAGNAPEIRVAAGTYVLQGALVEHPLRLIGGYPPGGGPRDRAAFETVLDAAGADYALSIHPEPGSALVDGLTFTGGMQHGLGAGALVTVRNAVFSNNPGRGVVLSGARLIRSRASSNGGAGIDARNFWTCKHRAIVDQNLVENNGRYGIQTDDKGCSLKRGLPGMIVRHNQVYGTRDVDGTTAGIQIHCCGRYYNNLVAGTEGMGVFVNTWDFPPDPDDTPFHHMTIVDNLGPGVYVGDDGFRMDHVVLWNNTEGDFSFMPPVFEIRNSLTEDAWPGSGNISGQDPLFATGPGGGHYLSQVSSGQAADSPGLDAGGASIFESAMREGTTRTDGIPDAAALDIGFHYEPPTWDLEKGTDPSSLATYRPNVDLPTQDAIAPGDPGLLFYRVTTWGPIRLERSPGGLDIRFDWQEYD